MRRLVLIITLLATFSVAALPAAADPPPADEPFCSADPAGCDGRRLHGCDSRA